MTKKHYVTIQAQRNGVREVHDETCKWVPAPENRKDLGEHFSCHTAVIEAERHYPQVNGCKRCSLPCNK